MLYELELVREASSKPHFVLAASIVGPDLFRYKSLIVFVDGDSFDKTVDLLAFGIDVNLAFLEEDCLFSVRATICKLLTIHVKFR